MAIDGSDLTSSMNQLYANNMNTLLGGTSQNVGGGLSGDLIQQWAMRGANGAAYRKLLEAQETGSIKPIDPHKYELMSDKYFNDYYDPETKTVTKPTYTAESNEPTAASSDTLTQLEALRNLAAAASGSPSSMNDNYVNLFNSMRQNIANSLVTKADDSSSTTVKTGEAQPATVKGKADFRYLTDDEKFTVAGKSGEKTYSFSAGASLQDIADAINADSAATGVSAEVELDSDGNATNIALSSTDTGKEAFVRVDQTTGSLFATAGSSTSAIGTAATETEAEVVAKGGDSKAAVATGVYTGKVTDDQEFTLTGANGSKKFSFAAGTSVEDIVNAINEASEEIGITASVIRNNSGEIEGMGLESLNAGQNQFVRVEQSKGYLFGAPGKTLNVYGTSENPEGANQINSLSQFGKVTLGGETYSFADLGPGGKISIDENPDIALAIIDQAIRDVYSGAAELKGVDLEEAILERPNMQAVLKENNTQASTTSNALEVNNFGSSALSAWIAERTKSTA